MAKKKKTEESGENQSGALADPTAEQVTSSPESAVAPPAAVPTDFAMSLTEFGKCRNLNPSIVAGLKEFLKGDVRPRKLSAWDSMLERYLKS